RIHHPRQQRSNHPAWKSQQRSGTGQDSDDTCQKSDQDRWTRTKKNCSDDIDGMLNGICTGNSSGKINKSGTSHSNSDKHRHQNQFSSFHFRTPSLLLAACKAATWPAISFASVIVEMTATPETPAAHTRPAFSAVMPPMPTTGNSGNSFLTARIPLTPAGFFASAFEVVPNTGPIPT